MERNEEEGAEWSEGEDEEEEEEEEGRGGRAHWKGSTVDARDDNGGELVVIIFKQLDSGIDVCKAAPGDVLRVGKGKAGRSVIF